MKSLIISVDKSPFLRETDYYQFFLIITYNHTIRKQGAIMIILKLLYNFNFKLINRDKQKRIVAFRVSHAIESIWSSNALISFLLRT